MEHEFQEAIDKFWGTRASQAEDQRRRGNVDAGLRGAVTGGSHLDGVREAVANLFVSAGIDSRNIRRNKGEGIVLPGFYRPTKDWDLVVVQGDVLVAAVELKSQVGPSFGNNFNNRTEEALGNAVDVWRAYEEGTFGNVRPWLGYVFVLEEAPGSTSPVRIRNSLYEVESIFADTSYLDRYSILCERLVRERLYDAAWFVASTKDGVVREPSTASTYKNFAAAIAGRCAYISGL